MSTPLTPTATLGRTPSTVRLPYQPSDLRKSRSRRLRIARALNVSEAVADKKLYGEHALNQECAKVIASDVLAGDLDAVAAFVAPIDAAMLSRDVPGFIEALCEYDKVDAEEDLVQAELRHRPLAELTDAQLDAYGRALARELYKGTQTLAALQRVQRDRRAR